MLNAVKHPFFKDNDGFLCRPKEFLRKGIHSEVASLLYPDGPKDSFGGLLRKNDKFEHCLLVGNALL